MVVVDLRKLLVEIGFAKSNSDAHRAIQQKAVKIDGNVVHFPFIVADEEQSPVRFYFK